MDAVLPQDASVSQNIKSGFKATGIHPFNPSKVLDKLPSLETPAELNESISNAVLTFLSNSRSSEGPRTKRRKKVEVAAGKPITSKDIEMQQDKVSQPRKELSRYDEIRKRKISLEQPAEGKSDYESLEENVSIKTRSAFKKPRRGHLKVSAWVVVEYCGGSTSQARASSNKLYAGQVTKQVSNSVFEVKFLRPPFDELLSKYMWPIKDDQLFVDFEKIVHILPEPLYDRRNNVIFPI